MNVYPISSRNNVCDTCRSPTKLGIADPKKNEGIFECVNLCLISILSISTQRVYA